MGGKTKLTTEEFIRRSIAHHGEGRHTYEKSVYVRSKTPLIITCTVHGDFEQAPHSHMRGTGCPSCSFDKRRIDINKPNKNMSEVLRLHQKGYKNYQIVEVTGLTEKTVRKYLYMMTGEKIPYGKAKNVMTDKQKDQVAIDRLTMTVNQVAEKWDRTGRYIRHVTKDHPLRDKFFSLKKKGVISPPKKAKYVSKKVPKPVDESKIHMDQSNMQKGNVKVKKGVRVFENKVFKKEEQRAVPLNDSKGTVVYVNMSDPRTNDDIRKVFEDKDKELLQSLRCEYLTNAKDIERKRQQRLMARKQANNELQENK